MSTTASTSEDSAELTEAERAAQNSVSASVEGVTIDPERTADMTYSDLALMAPTMDTAVCTRASTHDLTDDVSHSDELATDASAAELIEARKRRP